VDAQSQISSATALIVVSDTEWSRLGWGKLSNAWSAIPNLSGTQGGADGF
jgi:hypothetical protein